MLINPAQRVDIEEMLVPTNERKALVEGWRAVWIEGDMRRGREWFDAAYREAEAAGDGAAMATATLGQAGLWANEHRGMVADAILQDRLRRALESVPSESSLALRLRARLAAESDFRTAQHSKIITVVEEARRAQDSVAIAEALSLAHHCLLGPEHGLVRRPLASEMIAQGARSERRSDLLIGMLWHAVDLLLDGDGHSERGLSEVRTAVLQQEHLAVGYVLQAIDVMLDIRAGRLDSAELQAKAAAEVGSAAGMADALGWYGAHLVAIRWFQGRIAEMVPMLKDLAASPSLSIVDSAFQAALAVASAASGDRRTAIGSLARLGGGDLAAVPRSCSWLVTMYGAGEAAYLLGDAETARQSYELLTPFAKLPLMASLGIVCFGSAKHALGVAALAMGDSDRAVIHLREALRDSVVLGHWPAAILSRYRLGLAYLQSGSATDRVLGTEQIEAAQQEASEVGIDLPDNPLRAAAGAQTSPPGAKTLRCERRGRQWHLEMGGRSVLIDDCRGMVHLAVLLSNPRREVAAADLVGGLGTASSRPAASTQPVLDERAMAEYRQRLTTLQQEIDRFDAIGDRDGAIKAHTERDWILAELASATGLAGRVRAFTTTEERARVAVSNAIRRAIRRIVAADPILGEVLTRTIQTGQRCAYIPLDAP